MAVVRGMLLIIPSSIFAIIETYFLIIYPLITDNLPDFVNSGIYWALAIPVFMFTFGLSTMGVWIGYVMITTKEPVRFTYEEAYELAEKEVDIGN
jgi:hypothetical protein